MTIGEVREISGIGSEEERRIVEEAYTERVFDMSTENMAPREIPFGEFWKVERNSDIEVRSRFYRNGEPTPYVVADYKWDNRETPVIRGGTDDGQKEKFEFFGRIDQVVEDVRAREKTMRRLEGGERDRKTELAQLEKAVFGEQIDTDRDKEPHIAWIADNDGSVSRKSRLVLDGKETPYVLEQVLGWGIDMPGFQVRKYNGAEPKLVYEGYLDNAIVMVVRRAEKDNQKAQEETQGIGARALELVSREAA